VNRRLLTAIGLLTTGVALYLAFRGTNLSEVSRALREVGYLWAVPVVGGTLLSIWVRAYRWKIMLEPVKVIPTGKTYAATMIGFMANNVLPMRLGELVRAYSIGKSSAISKSSAFATIVVERAFDLLAVLLILGVMLLRYSFAPWVEVTGYVALGVCAGMFGLMALLRWKRDIALRIFRLVLRRLPVALREKAEGLLHRFLDGLEVLGNWRRLLWITVLSVLTWLAMASSFYAALLAFHLDVPADASLVLVVVSALAVMLPSGPGFVGTFEVGARYGLMLFKVPDDVALSYALFYHVVQFIPITLLGFYHLWRENFSLRRAVESEA
jgi:uncharacterized protein (TIRG00374 family)